MFIDDILRSGKGMMDVVPVGAKGDAGRERILVYRTNKDWDWTIVGVAFADEVTQEAAAAQAMQEMAAELERTVSIFKLE
ncbi:hypothetical protein [Massilia rubra]|uniref:hypothetical protein n=1 Tax=Massilia rubra TaxID=2607910 RepID=UPI001651BC64|nr:hypothetical protein [Massilia rubra]